MIYKVLDLPCAECSDGILSCNSVSKLCAKRTSEYWTRIQLMAQAIAEQEKTLTSEASAAAGENVAYSRHPQGAKP